MVKALDYESRDSRFDSWRGRLFNLDLSRNQVILVSARPTDNIVFKLGRAIGNLLALGLNLLMRLQLNDHLNSGCT